jgi:hypothetical protein
MKIVIPKPKGLAERDTKPHYYTLKGIGRVLIKTRQISEKSTAATDDDIPVSSETVTVSTSFTVVPAPYAKLPGANFEAPPVAEFTIEGTGDDERCLAEMGYYVSDYDEMQEARRLKRLTDIAKFLEYK